MRTGRRVDGVAKATFSGGARITKQGRIETTILNSLTPLSKADICRILPDVSPTVEAVLGKMVRNGQIRLLGAGRNTKYLRR